MYGACLSRAGFNRKTALATAAMTFAAEVPDVDIVTEWRGPVYGFQHHRGATHTFLGVPFDAAAALLIVYLFWRWRSSRRRKQGKPDLPPPRWGLLFGFGCIAAFSHILLDFTNSYGVRPLMPFSYKWRHWDIVSVVEPTMWVLLLGALVLPALFSLIQEEIGARRKGPRGRFAAIVALVLIAAMWGVRDFEHRRALAALDSMEYGGELPKRVSAYAVMINPFAWAGVVETDPSFRRIEVDSLTPEVDPHRNALVFNKPAVTPALESAKRSYLGQVFLDWADYPFFEVRSLTRGEEPVAQTTSHRSLTLPANGQRPMTDDPQLQLASFQALDEPITGYAVTMYDLRYYDVDLARGRRRRILGGVVELDRDLQPVAYYMSSLLGRNVQRVR